VFHKRNPQASFPGAPISAADSASSGQQTQPGVSAYMPRTAPRDVRGPTGSYNRQGSSETNVTTQTTQPLNTNSEGHRPMNSPNDNNSPQSQTPQSGRPMDIPGTMPYGRPMAPGMGGAYGASHNAAYNPYGSGRKLIIGEGITMSGEIEHCDHLIVEGTVQATLKDAKLLDISEAGVFYGTVDIEEATIAGRFEGDINVAGRLTVKASGVITGSIRYKELAIEAGASIEGTLSPTGPRKSEETVASADFSKGKQVAKQAREAAKSASNNDQLFGGKDAVSAAQ
jgi:cytoskeletal protein CcmA (bactofilin family)